MNYDYFVTSLLVFYTTVETLDALISVKADKYCFALELFCSIFKQTLGTVFICAVLKAGIYQYFGSQVQHS